MQQLRLLSTYVAKGGKTATAVAPAGTRVKDAAKVGMLESVGEPPPPGVPGCGALRGARPLCWKFKSGIFMTIPIIIIPVAAAAGAATSSTKSSTGD